MLHPRRSHLGVALAALALLTAGCGSSSDDGAKAAAAPAAATTVAKPAAAAPAAAPTRATYIRRADRVCLLARGVSRRANEVVQKAFAAGHAGRAADAIDSYMPLFTQHLQALKDLPQPKGKDTAILQGLIKVMDSQVQALADESKALRQQDGAAMQQISKAQQQELQFAEDLGRQYGFKVCGRSA
jgi:pyruvate/2-oxoglutarate dehydrogenase complex dihydrolipoamide acyltransferase (E2) component